MVPSAKSIAETILSVLLVVLSCFVKPIVGLSQDKSGLFDGATLGGAFHWSDEANYRDWRIQRHALLGHSRLIDPDNRRRAFGSYKTCLSALQKIKPTLEPLPKHAVVVIHGLGACRELMQPLSEYLQHEGRFFVINYGYASTLKTIEESSISFRCMLENLEGIETVDVVAHSLGNIIVRRTLHDISKNADSPAAKVKFNRFVMISPPNHGAEVASKFQRQPFVKSIADILAGPVLEEINPERGWPTTEESLCTPSFPFGIIIGGTGKRDGYVDFIAGDDDGLLSPITQELSGATEIVQVPGLHQLMPSNAEVQKKCLSYLKFGKFLED